MFSQIFGGVFPSHCHQRVVAAWGVFPMDSPSYSRSSHNDRLPAGSPAFLPRNRRLLVSRLGDRPGPAAGSSSESEDDALGGAAKPSRCAKCGHLLMGMLFCRNCGQRRSGTGLDAMDFASAFGGIKDAVREEQQRQRHSPRSAFVLHSVDAVACVLQEMLQLKYGLLLDDSDLLGKLRHHCNGATPEEVVKLFNAQRDLHVRSMGSQRLVALRLDWTPLSSFEALQAKVRSIPGTCSAVAVLPSLLTEDAEAEGAAADCAVAIFREAYSSYPRNLMGRCAGPTPLVAMSARHFRWAASLEPQILSELRGMGPSRKPMECGAPCWRDEYSTVVKNEERGFSYENPVPKLQLPLHSGRSDGRTSRSRPRSPKRSARLTSQCSTEATSPGRSPERNGTAPVAGLQLGHGMEAPWNLWDPSPGVFAPASLLPYQEPVSNWPMPRLGPPSAAGLTPPSGLIAPQLTPRHLGPFGGAATPVMYT